MIKPTPGSGAPKAEIQLLAQRLVRHHRPDDAKKIKAPRSPHAVTVIHACRTHQRCSADAGLGFIAPPPRESRFSHRSIRMVHPWRLRVPQLHRRLAVRREFSWRGGSTSKLETTTRTRSEPDLG